MKKDENLKLKSESNNPIEAIRSIIFGDQEKTFNHKLNDIYKHLETLSQELAAKFTELQQQQDKDRKEFSQKNKDIQILIEENKKSTDQKLKQISNTIQENQSELNSKKLNSAVLADQLENLVKFLRNSE